MTRRRERILPGVSRVTIGDVARAAEVSTATVSNVRGGTGRVSEATRARVRAVAGALGYGPVSGGGRTLGLAVTAHGDSAWDFASVPYFAQAISAATVAAHRRGYALMAMDSGPAEHMWRTLPAAGVVVLDSPAGDPVVRMLRARGLPLVFDGRPGDLRARETWVDNDHEAMTRRVLDHLAGQGAERIALIAGPTQEYYSRASATAYRRWCSRAGVRPCVVPFDEDDSAGRGLDALLTGEGGPDAVFGLYDPCGRQILAAATRCGLSVPEDLMVVCGSEDPAYGRTVPPVSTVSLAPEQAGTAAVDALVSLVEDPPHTPPPVVIGTRLVVRSSSMRRSRRQAS
ncbi:LacI family DNA-binding transcriptional regulator [Streptomyces sp. 110]|uniref:LacI family DNA-binding transcriptional regulator n=1 Tax=Streptomyces endocoffeicus TaxID=2898945 RepID=A0ABS1PWR9_9ACTN|nr:LacI family DNA-binding transcriptional regulator [Streptomyces endocoffeicus]